MSKEYNSIRVLSSVEHIRRRPHMYISSERPSFQMFDEIFSNAVDEAMNGYADTIRVSVDFKTNSISVYDNGRGLPQHYNDNLGEYDVVLIYTYLNAGGKFDQETYGISSGLHGAGSCVVNALSKNLSVSTWRGKSTVKATFELGEKISYEESTSSHDSKSGTFVSYEIDSDHPVFIDRLSDYEKAIYDKLRLIKSILPSIHLYYNDEEINEDKFTNFVDLSSDPLFKESIYIKNKYSMLAFNWSKDNNKVVQKSYCNAIFTPNGGDHVNGIHNAFIDIFGDDVTYGLTIALSVNYPAVEYDSQAKLKAISKDMKSSLTEDYISELKSYFRSHPDEKSKIIDLMHYKRAEMDKRKNKSNVRRDRRSAFLNSLGVSGFADCDCKDRSEAELYIVEGNSAAGSAMQARDIKHQAILPLRGKFINAYNANVADLLKNAEVATIVSSIDAGIFQDVDIRKSRYDKIIIFCFTGDTPVKLLDGRTLTFKELVDLEESNPGSTYWVYSMTNDGTMVPCRAHHPRITRYTNELCHVILDNGYEIKCTPDHLFMLRDGSYKEARYLTTEDSLMPLYTKIEEGIFNTGKEKIYDNNTGNWVYTHRAVKEFTDPLRNYDGVHCHHINKNKLDNSPDNLTWLSKREHSLAHYEENSKIMTEYNASDSHKSKIKDLHSSGVYEHTYFGHRDNSYNTSDKHRSDVSNAWKRGRYSSVVEHIREYNSTEENRESTRRLNTSPEMKRLQQRGKLAKVGKSILDQGLSLTIDRINSREYNSDRYISMSSILKYYDTFEDFVEASTNYNHKISSVWVESLEDSIPMYDITVEGCHNFVIPVSSDSGIVVHNCDADEDGKNISCLLMSFFIKTMPELVQDGRLYLALPPLYGTYEKDKFIPINTEELKNDYLTKGYSISRYKGLGEMNPEQLRISCMDPETRQMIRIDLSEECADQIEKIMGSDTSYRKQLLIDTGILKI